MDIKQIGTNVRSWIGAAQDGDYSRTRVNVALNLRVPCIIKLVNE
jgi:hypothetical protein